MFTRKARASYTGKALRLWFDILSNTWESVYFSDEELALGREYYRKGFIEEIELSEKTLSAMAKFDDDSKPYCVIDLISNKLRFRCSVANEFFAKCLSVAALYELSELMSDSLHIIDNDEAKAEKEEEKAPEVIEEKPEIARDFILEFATKKKGLFFNTFILDGKKKRSIYAKASLNLELNNAEREQLIRLSSLSKKAGFEFVSSGQILGDYLKIINFVNNVLPSWKKYFKIEKKDNIYLLGAGARTVTLSAKVSTSSNNIFSLDWAISLNGKEIDVAYLKNLSSTGVSLVPDFGMLQFAQADEEIYKYFEKARSANNSHIPNYMLFSLYSDLPNLIIDARAKELLDDFKLENISEENTYGFLRGYQAKAVSWAKRLFEFNCNVLLADEMGLGKTVQTLALIKEYSKEAKSVIVMCPASVIPVWKSECEKFFPELTCEVLNSKFDKENCKANIILSSYTQIRKNRNLVDSILFELVVLDEAQFIKNPEAKTTVACMALKAKRKIALTGTPIENKLIDLWTIFRWLMPRLLPEKTEFKAIFYNYKPEALEKVKRQIAPFCLRRLKKDVAKQLPDKIYADLICPLSDLQQLEYKKLLAQAKKDFGEALANKDNKKKLGVLALLMRLRQVACDAGLLPWVDCDYKDSAKISLLCDRVDELFLNNKKILIFSQFTSLLKRVRSAIEERCPDMEILELTGSTKDRQKPVEAFQSAKKPTVILVSLKAGGTGITLTDADYVFFMDPWWNPAAEEQAVDRVHRIGRTGDVFIYRMYAQGTVEDAVRKLQESKKELFEDVFGQLRDVSLGDNFNKTMEFILNNVEEKYEG